MPFLKKLSSLSSLNAVALIPKVSTVIVLSRPAIVSHVPNKSTSKWIK